MNKNCSLAVAILSSLFAISANAETPDAKDLVGRYYVGMDSMYIDTDANRQVTSSPLTSLDHGYGVGLQLGYRLTETFELRAIWSSLNIEVENNNAASPDAGLVGLDGLYFPDARSFYFVGGITQVELEDKEPSLNLGAGYRYYFADNFSAHVEARTFYDLDNEFNDYAVGLGLVYFFDQPSHPSPILAPKDSDMDGVPDNKDNCPNSPAGAKVNSFGCADSDNDGIADNLDLCPSSPSGAMVNQQGCPDGDKDGVPDNLDQCLTTPSGDKVNHIGCPLAIEQPMTVELLVYFDNNKSMVKPNYLAEIERVAAYMNKYPHTQVTLAGHTSILGESHYNQKLSERRAKAVAEILIARFGIPASRVTAIGYGESQLRNTASSAEAHKENRRMEAIFSTKDN